MPLVPFPGIHNKIARPPHGPSGCIIIIENEKRYLNLTHVEAHTSIVSSTSRTKLTQTFHNPTDKALSQVRYVFPLLDGVSVVAFQCTIGKRTIKGSVKERQEAKDEFAAAISRGEKAGLLEQSEDAADVFTTTLGNVGAGEDVEVEITFIGELEHDAEVDGLRFTLPTAIAPRYSPERLLGQISLAQSVKKTKTSKLNISVDIDMADKSAISKVQSPSHPIAVNIGTLTNSSDAPSLQKASASLSLGNADLEGDFVLQVVAAGLGDPFAVMEEHATIANRRALLTSLVPRFSLPNDKPEIVFICDRSGSMGTGNKIPNLITALEIFLKSLPVGVLFNICGFGSRHEFKWSKSQPYDQTTLDDAIKYAKTFDSDFGGTEMLAPIKETFERRAKDRNLEVFLLTDGQVWNQDELFKMINTEVKDNKGAIRLFTLAIGKEASSSLVKGMARAGNGFSQSVGDNETMNKKVVRMLKGALTPHVQDYKLEIKYEKDDDDFELVEKIEECLNIQVDDSASKEAPAASDKPEISLHDTNVTDEALEQAEVKSASVPTPEISAPKYLQAPFDIPPLFPFNRTNVYVLLSESGQSRKPVSAILTGTSTQGPLKLEIPISTLAAPGTTIHQLAARKAVQDLEEGRGWVYKANDSDGQTIKEKYALKIKDIAKAQGVKLGVEYQISNKWCSFVAVEGGDEKTDVGDFETISKPEDSHQIRSMAMPQMFMARAAPMRARHARMAPAAASAAAGDDLFGSAPLPPPPAPMTQSFGGGALQSVGNAQVQPQGLFDPQDEQPLRRLKQSQQQSQQGEPARLEEEEEEDKEEMDEDLFSVPNSGQSTKTSTDGIKLDGKNPTEIVAALQTFVGNWTWSETLEKVIGVTKDKAQGQKLAKIYDNQDDILATICAVTYLKKKQSSESDVWELFVQKAEEWLEQQTGESASGLEEAFAGLF